MKIQQIYILYDFLSLSGLIPNISKLKKEEKKKKEKKSALKQEKTLRLEILLSDGILLVIFYFQIQIRCNIIKTITFKITYY